jgi:formate hydrogenlyase subunit 3/multisubunit Na+/H+ antiporter MnhD subunit
MLVGPLLLITVWALEGRSLNPNDESLIRLGGFSLILAIAIGLGVFPLSFWLPPIFRINNPLAVLLSFILQITLLVRLSSVFTISLWPGGQQVLYSLLVTAGFVTIIGAGVLAVIQESLGGILAYTVIADMGVVLVGIGLGTSSALQTSILHLGLRGLAIAGSSVGVSVLRTYYGTDSVARLKGAWHSNRLAVIGLSLCALSLVGLPFTAGFVSRLTILSMSGTNRVGWVIASIAAGFGPAFAWGRFLIFTRGRVDEAPRRTLLGPSILCVFIGAMLLVIGIYPRVIQLLPAEWLTALARVAMPLIR